MHICIYIYIHIYIPACIYGAGRMALSLDVVGRGDAASSGA